MHQLNASTKRTNGLMRIGELARQCQKSVRALHLYEDLGLLQPTSRTKGRFRLYDPAAAERVEWIGKLQGMGLSLTEIQQILRGSAEIKTAPAAMRHIRGIFTARLRQTEETIQRLTHLRDEMQESLRYLEKCHECKLEQVACETCGVQRPPQLVAEFRPGDTDRNPRRVETTPAGQRSVASLRALPRG
jgi:DNA-binding transcriptional MerR regulator